MRTRYLLLFALPVVLLLALGAVPSLLGGGDVHYVVATEAALEGGDPPDENVTGTIDATNLSEGRFPYATGALEADDGVSEPYEEGPFGIKESFTHAPFDEFGEFDVWNPNATAPDDDVAYLERNGTYYRLEITGEPDAIDDGERSNRQRLAGP